MGEARRRGSFEVRKSAAVQYQLDTDRKRAQEQEARHRAQTPAERAKKRKSAALFASIASIGLLQTERV